MNGGMVVAGRCCWESECWPMSHGKTCGRFRLKMRAKLKPRPTNAPKEFQPKRLWSDATINRHFAFLRHVLMLAVKDGKLTQNPVSGLKFFPEVKRTRFLSE